MAYKLKLPFVRCDLDCLGLCALEGDTCRGWLDDGHRPPPTAREELVGAIRIVKSEKIVMTSAGQIYSADPARSETFGELPQPLVINIWRAWWQNNLVVGREPDMVYEIDVSDHGEATLAAANRIAADDLPF